MVKKVEKRALPRISIKLKMIAILLCFFFVFGFSLWVLQVRMLTFFYQNAKFAELEQISTSISLKLDNYSEILTVTNEYSDTHSTDIWIYKINGKKINEKKPLIFADGTNEGLSPFLEPEFSELYQKTEANNGIYIAVVPMENFAESYFNFKVISDNFNATHSYPVVNQNFGDTSVFYLSIHNNNHGDSYLLIQRSNIVPDPTIIRTMETQYVYICTLTILFSVVLATVFSKLITKPIVKINETAKDLALGKYDTTFSGHGYREAEELSDTLNYVSGELSKNEKLQKELISNLSHDLRTPLTMIKGYGEVMRDIPGENTSENIQIIIDEASRLSDLVNDMFDLSRLQTGVRRPAADLFSITESVRATLHRYKELTKRRGYKIEFISEEDVYVFADRGMILQVVYNLINNAINYSADSKEILVKQDIIEDKVRISVIDNGEGILESEIPFIWDRYYKVDKQHKRATVGTGLGLSIVKGILELHNATYGVTSTPGRGSTFWFELQIANESEYSSTVETLGE